MKSDKTFLSALKLGQVFTVCALCALSFGATAAEVVQRSGTVARPTASRNNAVTRMPTMVTQPTKPAESISTEIEEVIEIEEPIIVIENKSSQFDSALGATSTTDIAGDQRAEMIRRQRAALDAADATATATQKIEAALTSGMNVCDTNLRDCMKDKCGNDFSKCAGDGDTIWGNKIEACRRDSKCSGTEFNLFSKEIRADRDHNSKMASYNEAIECGNNYNRCIVTQCGNDFSKCISKKYADAAIANCNSIAKDCQRVDTGFANRTNQVFGTLRNNAQAQAAKDEKRLYELRDLMSAQCRRLGAMFDERSLDCVFTANFFANNSANPMASKKLYAGDSFNCTPDWFGVDVTTYIENAQRLTREQKSATSAMMGSGLGIAAGSIASGAINRAIDTQKAEKAVKKAEKEHDQNFGDNKPGSDTDEKAAKKQEKKQEPQEKKEKKDKEKKETKTPR